MLHTAMPVKSQIYMWKKPENSYCTLENGGVSTQQWPILKQVRYFNKANTIVCISPTLANLQIFYKYHTSMQLDQLN